MEFSRNRSGSAARTTFETFGRKRSYVTRAASVEIWEVWRSVSSVAGTGIRKSRAFQVCYVHELNWRILRFEKSSQFRITNWLRKFSKETVLKTDCVVTNQSRTKLVGKQRLLGTWLFSYHGTIKEREVPKVKKVRQTVWSLTRFVLQINQKED